MQFFISQQLVRPIENDVAIAMEKELKELLTRYPIPLLVSAFDNKEDVYNLSGLRPNNQLFAFFDENGVIGLHWELVKDEDIPDIALNNNYVNNIYSKLPFQTEAELILIEPIDGTK